MEFFKDITSVKTSCYFETLRSGRNIDLRKELSIILHGDPNHIPMGHWVVLRHFTGQINYDYYNPSTKEGIGGPAYSFVDTVIKTRKNLPGVGGAPISEIPMQIGSVFEDKYKFYFEHDTKISIGDQIIEFQWDDHTVKPDKILNLKFTRKYTVKLVHDFRMDKGRIEYLLIAAEDDRVRL